MKSVIIFVCLAAVILTSCQEKKVEPVPVGEMSEYKDPAYGFKIKYPKDWKQLGTTGKAVFAMSDEVIGKFQNPASGIEGAMVTAEVIRYEGKTAADLIAANKDDLKQIQTLSFGSEEQTTVAGKPATKVPYTIKVTTKTNIAGYEIFIPGDTALYKLDLVGYGDQFGAHGAVFDAMVKSYELPVIVVKKPDVWTPSANSETYKSAFFAMNYPDNLEMVDVKKGNNDFAMEMRADRRDCSIHLDVFGAKGLTVDKVWEQNKSRYKSRKTGNIDIDGNKAFWVDYSPVSNINSRAYFVVKNDKVVRATLNWFAPQKDIYFPAFEKCINSLKLN